jgi:hypothetical protein
VRRESEDENDKGAAFIFYPDVSIVFLVDIVFKGQHRLLSGE